MQLRFSSDEANIGWKCHDFRRLDTLPISSSLPEREVHNRESMRCLKPFKSAKRKDLRLGSVVRVCLKDKKVITQETSEQRKQFLPLLEIGTSIFDPRTRSFFPLSSSKKVVQSSRSISWRITWTTWSTFNSRPLLIGEFVVWEESVTSPLQTRFGVVSTAIGEATFWLTFGGSVLLGVVFHSIDELLPWASTSIGVEETTLPDWEGVFIKADAPDWDEGEFEGVALLSLASRLRRIYEGMRRIF